MPHYQHRNGGRGHVFYKAAGLLSAIIPFLIDMSPAWANDMGGGVGNEGEDLDGDGVDDSVDEVVIPLSEDGFAPLPDEETQEEKSDDPEDKSDPDREEEEQNQ